MNVQQEIILDQLVTAEKIGDRWQPGPLQLALRALQAGELSDFDDVSHGLGFPLPFCAAISGGSEVLDKLEEVRGFAISLFSEISPQDQLPELTFDELALISIWSARQVYQHWGPVNRACREIMTVFDEYESDPATGIDFGGLSRQIERVIEQTASSGRRPFTPKRIYFAVFFFALHTIRQATEYRLPIDNAALCCRDAARFLTMTGGLDETVPYCLQLAEWTGISS